MRGGIRQISGRCVRCRAIATGPKCQFMANVAYVLVTASKLPPRVHPLLRPADLLGVEGAGRGDTKGEAGTVVDAQRDPTIGV